jgi:hypothetical protein
MYPEGEFLCIVSKQYDRGTREDNNNHVSERVKVINHQTFTKKFMCIYSRFCKNVAHACDFFFLIHFFPQARECCCSIFFSLFFVYVYDFFFICVH